MALHAVGVSPESSCHLCQSLGSLTPSFRPSPDRKGDPIGHLKLRTESARSKPNVVHQPWHVGEESLPGLDPSLRFMHKPGDRALISNDHGVPVFKVSVASEMVYPLQQMPECMRHDEVGQLGPQGLLANPLSVGEILHCLPLCKPVVAEPPPRTVLIGTDGKVLHGGPVGLPETARCHRSTG